jgi:F420H(2)-dependent quinone reductase
MDQRQQRADSQATWVRGHRGIMRVLWTVHRFFYRLTGGAIGGKMQRNPVLLLTTTSRKSGKERTIALSYFPDGDDLVVVASNGGQDVDPAWWTNLKANPRATVQLGSRKLAINAEQAPPQDRERLWSVITRQDPTYAGYAKLTSREIPVVVLRPVKSS